MDSKDSCKSWFCVFNNPEKLEEYKDLEPKEIAEKVLEIWIDNKVTRTGAVAYCISAGGLHHLHMVLEDTNKSRFSALKKLYPTAHLEPTRGNKTQAEDYINKKGKYDEKDEQVIYIAKFGEIKGYQGARRDIEIISDMIEQGSTPNEIYDTNFAYRRYESMIRKAYFDKRYKETEYIRDVKVYWHIGDSGSGKSYTSKQLVDKIGEENVYVVTDYKNGGFDMYNGQKVLFLDEFRGQIDFYTFLKILDVYKVQVHSRYSNVYTLWDEVHITSVLTPSMCYDDIFDNYGTKCLEKSEQLLRRIDMIVYHYKHKGQYCSYCQKMDDFASYTTLKNLAVERQKIDDEFADYEEIK